MKLKPPIAEGIESGSGLRPFWRAFVRQLSWLIFGVPEPHRRGRWVWNSRDKTWRFYLDEIE